LVCIVVRRAAVAVLMAGHEVDPGRDVEVDEDADWNETEDLDDGTEPLPPACDGGMSGRCGQLERTGPTGRAGPRWRETIRLTCGDVAAFRRSFVFRRVITWPTPALTAGHSDHPAA
jgi:hypothetical protein